MNIYAMIPARIGSKRLKKKNIYPFRGKPMISYAINACLQSELIKRVIVSTESEEIGQIAKNFGAEVLKRPASLAKDNIPTQDVMKHFIANYPETDVLVLVQANSPNVRTETIDRAIRKLIEHNLREVRSVNFFGLENGAIWVVSKEAIAWDGLSVYFGVILDNSVDIHTIDDVKKAEDYEEVLLHNKQEENS